MIDSSQTHVQRAPHLSKPGVELIVILGALTAFSPLSVDTYLPAFPSIARDLNIPSALVQQTLAIFFLGMASGQLIYGPLSDRFGRRPLLLAGIVIYIAGSIGCALALSLEALTFWRLLQGLGGCAGIVIARAVVRDRFDSVNAAQVLSQLMLVMGIAPIIGPLIGGQLLRYGNWRSIFWVLTAFGLLGAVVTIFRLQESWGRHHVSIHPVKIGLTFWDVLRDRTFLIPALTVGFSQASMFTYIMGSPGVFINHYGVSQQHFGLFFGANAVGLMIATQVNRQLLKHYFPYRILHFSTAAMAFFGLVILVLGWSQWGGFWAMAAALFLLLCTIGFVGANGTACALANQGRRAGSASALIGSMHFGFASLVGFCAARLCLIWPSLGTPLHSMSTFIALCALTAAVLHWSNIGSKTEKIGVWMRRITRKLGFEE
jgi:MFS transporter, DHA1 family, multidrug resistance protein